MPFKPFCGRCFEMKNFTNLQKYPKVVLIMDEKKDEVMFLDDNSTSVWIPKYYLRDNPIQSRVFSSPDTVENAVCLLEKMRAQLVSEPSFQGDSKRIANLNKLVSEAMEELRDLGTRMQGVKFAPPLQETTDDV